MTPIIIDADTGRELWRIADCAAWCGIRASTWRQYTAAGRVPTPGGQLGKTPLWNAEEVKTWHANRPGSPVRNHP